jgi:hypothetical protein
MEFIRFMNAGRADGQNGVGGLIENVMTGTIQENIKTTIDNLPNLSLIPVVDNLYNIFFIFLKRDKKYKL